MQAFGFFRPDMADTSGDAILRAAVNVFYKPGGLGPVPSPFILPAAQELPEPPRGGISGVTAAGVYQAFVGTETTFQKLNNDGTWTDVSPAAPALQCPAGDNWSFAAFGKYIIATNKADGMYYYDLDAGGLFTQIVGAPVARIIFRAFNALFAGDCDGNNRVLKSSKLGDPLIWVGPGTTYREQQVGEEILGGGEISNQSALLIQRNAVTPMNRRPDAKIYDMGTSWTGIGATNPEAIVFVTGYALFVSTKGFYAVASDGLPIQIGDGKVDKWFLTEISGGGLDRVQGALWQSENVVVFRYNTSGGDLGITTDALSIDLGENAKFEFAQIDVTASLILSMATPGYTLDDMDGFGALDLMTQIALDSRFWFGGEPRFGIIDENYQFGFMEGPSGEATIEGSTTAGSNSTLISFVSLLSDAVAPSIYIGVSDVLSAVLTWLGPFTRGRSGVIPTRARGKNIRYRTIIPAADPWTFATGISDVTGSQGGVL